MPQGIYAGRGASGLKGTKRMKEDVLALSDAAKRERRLERKVAGKQKEIKQKEKTPRVSERTLDRFRSQDHKIRRLQGQVVKMRLKAKEVERSGTGNTGAAKTYRRAADAYLDQIAKIKKGT